MSGLVGAFVGTGVPYAVAESCDERVSDGKILGGAIITPQAIAQPADG